MIDHPNPGPPTMTETEKLIERLEAASGPDREIDLAIWRLVDPIAAEVEAEGKIPLPWVHCYTASIAAAMTLIPEGHKVMLAENLDDDHWRATLSWRDCDTDPWMHPFSLGQTAPLAICIAALKARQP